MNAGETNTPLSKRYLPTDSLPDAWRWETTEGVCEGIFDCPHSTPALTTNGPLLVRSQDIRSTFFRYEQAAHVSEETYAERIRRAEPRYGDLLYSREGTYFGITAEVPQHTRVCLGQRMVLLRPDAHQVNFRYLRFWLNSVVMTRYIEGFHDGSVAQRLNVATIRKLPVAVPPLEEQRAITKTLGALDDKIELNRRMNATLEGMARGLFKSWFVDFDPVTAKAAGRQPFGLSADVAALFPDRFTDSPLGPIPDGWRCATVPEIIDVNPTRKLARTAQAPYLDMRNMPTDSAVPEQWVPRAAGSGMRFQNGDTLLARITPCLENGKTAFVNFLRDGQVAWGSTEYIVLRSKPPLPAEFSYLLARDDDFRSFAIANMTGSSGRQRVPATVLSHYLVAVPTREIAAKFGRILAPIFLRILRNVIESRSLAATRDALLPRLLSGEIRLRRAEKIVEEVA